MNGGCCRLFPNEARGQPCHEQRSHSGSDVFFFWITQAVRLCPDQPPAPLTRPAPWPQGNSVRPRLASLHNGRDVIAVCSGRADAAQYDYKTLMLSSVFSAAPAGNGLHSYRLAEAIFLGAIPVIVDEKLILPFCQVRGGRGLEMPEGGTRGRAGSREQSGARGASGRQSGNVKRWRGVVVGGCGAEGVMVRGVTVRPDICIVSSQFWISTSTSRPGPNRHPTPTLQVLAASSATLFPRTPLPQLPLPASPTRCSTGTASQSASPPTASRSSQTSSEPSRPPPSGRCKLGSARSSGGSCSSPLPPRSRSSSCGWPRCSMPRRARAAGRRWWRRRGTGTGSEGDS